MKRCKSLIIGVFLMLGFLPAPAQTPGFAWAISGGGMNAENATGIVCLSDGSSYVTGTFNGLATFGSHTLVSNGDKDIFVLKLSPSGAIIWARQAGGSDVDQAQSISADSAGNCLVAGHFYGTAEFGSHTLIENGSWGPDIFVAKLDAAGNWLWAVQAGGLKWDFCNAICTDHAGNSYIAGSSQESATFGSFTINSGLYPDIYVAKLDGSGNWLWVINAGGSDPDEALGICMASDSDVFVTGYSEGPASFGTHNLDGFGNTDVFVAKVDGSGSWAWVNAAGSNYLDRGCSIASDDSGGCRVTGYFMESAVFGTEVLQSSSTNYDIFFAMLGPDGDWQWARQAGGASWNDVGTGIAVDAQGNAYATGYFYLAANFGPYALSAVAENEIFITKLDAAGNWLWAKRAGGSSDDFGRALDLDQNADIYITGAFWGDTHMDAIPMTSCGDFDVFIAKISASSSAFDETGGELSPPCSSLSAYPNPLPRNADCTIITDLLSGESGILTVFNQRGQQVARYNLEPGQQQMHIDSSGLAPGIYFYRLETKSQRTVRKLVIF